MSNDQFRPDIGHGALEPLGRRVKPQHGQGPEVLAGRFDQLLRYIAEGIVSHRDLFHNRRYAVKRTKGVSSIDMSISYTRATV